MQKSEFPFPVLDGFSTVYCCVISIDRVALEKEVCPASNGLLASIHLNIVLYIEYTHQQWWQLFEIIMSNVVYTLYFLERLLPSSCVRPPSCSILSMQPTTRGQSKLCGNRRNYLEGSRSSQEVQDTYIPDLEKQLAAWILEHRSQKRVQDYCIRSLAVFVLLSTWRSKTFCYRGRIGWTIYVPNPSLYHRPVNNVMQHKSIATRSHDAHMMPE